MTADQIIAHFQLAPHPEGGWYRQTWIAAADSGARPVGTAILFLLRAGEHSHWHKVDATEIWHFHAGAALELRLSETLAGPAQTLVLGSDLAAGQAPQGIVPPDWWQSARSLGAWSLVGCTVSPGFRFDGFELAAPEVEIPSE